VRLIDVRGGLGYAFLVSASICVLLQAQSVEQQDAYFQEVTLNSGQVLVAESLTRDGAKVLLTVGGGQIEVDESQISIIEIGDLKPKRALVPAEEPAAAVTEMAIAVKTVPEMLRAAANRHGLPVEFVMAVAKAESGFQVKALSPKGAIGVMQLMPETAKQLKVNPHDPEQNIDAGVRLLKTLLLQYGQDGTRALAAYNAGPGAVAKYQGVPPYSETVQYVKRILTWYQQAK
jgi:soluble lytic murein transglycosylase-like protein